ncbi:hypothetical protein ACFYM0_36985 [Streptomyces sp. NPDC006487]|uniref:hypothetical protein n=1 Tax=Streptomyces sp. NPDC006487 TaxID=3364748 RepID=UPI00368F2CED
MRSGRTGLWTKGIAGIRWSFTPTDQPLRRPLVSNPPGDRSTSTLAPASPYSYSAGQADRTVSVDHFNVATGTTPLTVRFKSGASVQLVLHTVDALRQFPRADGLDGTPRAYTGAVEVPRPVWLTLLQQPEEVRTFLMGTLGGRLFTTTDVQVTDRTMRIGVLGLTLGAR